LDFGIGFDHESPGGQDAVAGVVDRSAPVRSLDQLYSQALGLAPVFAGLCESLARASNAVVDHPPEDPEDSLGPASPAGPVCGRLEHWVRRRFVKSPARAIEKALVCYGGDVSRLVDVCRGRLAFDSLADLAGCLESVGADRSFRIARAKDRISHSDEARACGGFRVRAGPANSVFFVAVFDAGFASLPMGCARCRQERGRDHDPHG
jgi:hypothetical protein